MTTTHKDVEVRAVEPVNADDAYGLMADIFMPNSEKAVAAVAWREFVESAPGQPHDRARAAFLEDRCVGVYVIDEREVHLAGATVRAGFIGMVGVQRKMRGSGIGTALMNDSFSYARRRGLALLVLHGTPRYYTPFGYVDVFDTSDLSFRRTDVAAPGVPLLHVRTAVASDAGAIAELYQEAHRRYSGWCVRSEAQEEHWLRFATLPATERGQLFDTVGPVVAVDYRGEVQGYLRQGWGPLRTFGCEVAAASPEAVLSLAAYHSGLRGPLQGRDEVVTWQLPPGSLTAEWLGDFLPITVCSTHWPAEGWMAAVTEKTTLVDGLVQSWSGVDSVDGGFSLRVGDVRRAVGRVLPGAAEVGLDAATLLQLLFGYREPSWAQAQPGCVLPGQPALEHLLTNQPWIPPSNGW